MLNVLQAFLALATTMLALATLVTIIIEFVSRLSRRRFRLFTRMLRQIFEKELQPLIEDQVKAKYGIEPTTLQNEFEKHLTAFLGEIRNSPLEAKKDKSKFSWLGGWLRWFGADKSSRLTTEEFLRRLARSETGRAVYQQASAHLETVVDSISLRYEELMEAMRDYIKNSSAVLSVVIGIILSFSLNIDALRILNFYLENPNVAEKIALKADAYLKSYEDAREKMEKAFAELEASDFADVDTKKAAKMELEEMNKRFEQISAAASDLEIQGIPIGTDYFPYCRYRTLEGDSFPCMDSETRFKTQSFEKRLMLDYFFWILKVLITGMLIGLGGPFWYDAVRGLMRTTQLFRGRDQPREPIPGKREEETKPDKPSEIFEKHVGMKGISGVRRRLHGSGTKGDVAAQATRARKAADARMASRATLT
jgi:hypothetical protein